MIKQLDVRYKLKNNIGVALLGALIFGWIIFSIIFPVFKINDKMRDDFSLRNINGRQYLELKIKGGHSFHKILIKTNKQDDNIKEGKILGKVYQDELGLYFLGEKIRNREQLDRFLKIKNSEKNIENGELIKKGNFVYFISNNKYRAFANAEIFDTLGFDWEKVQGGKSDLLSDLTKGEIIDKNNSYLPNSFVEINKKVYLVGLEKKYLIGDTKLEKYIKDKFSIIRVDDKKLQIIGSIKCQQSFRKKNICKFKDTLKMVLPQATVFIELEDRLPLGWISKIYTFDGINSLVPRRTLSNIKRNLILRYDQRLGLGDKVNK
jgi:hypothetical protein